MSLFKTLRGWMGGSVDTSAASARLPDLTKPRVRGREQGYPSFFQSTTPDRSSPLTRNDRRVANIDLLNYRNGRDTYEVVRDFVATSPNLSNALWAYLRVGIPERYTLIAKNLDGTFNKEATNLAHQLAVRFDVLPDYSKGFSGTSSIRSTSEQLSKEIIQYGSMAAELVLGPDRLPRRIQPISVTQIQLYPDRDKGVRPVQVIGQDEIDLDIPTFFYEQLDQDLLEPYSSSPLQPAIKPTIFVEDFLQDIHRIVKRVIHPRQKVEIDEEKFRRYLSPEAQNNPEKAREEMARLVSNIESQVNGLRPEDALVYFDMLGFTVENPAETGLSDEYETISNIANARLASGAKTLGTVLGFQSGSSNIASVETMLFMKSANGAVKAKLDEMYSRIFTLAVRLFGMDCYAEFRYEAIDLRPDLELEAFRQTKQGRILDQLSLGIISDEEASILITGKLPLDGAPVLSGTMFRHGQEQGGASIQEQSNSGSTLNQRLNPDTPTQGRGHHRDPNRTR